MCLFQISKLFLHFSSLLNIVLGFWGLVLCLTRCLDAFLLHGQPLWETAYSLQRYSYCLQPIACCLLTLCTPYNTPNYSHICHLQCSFNNNSILFTIIRAPGSLLFTEIMRVLPVYRPLLSFLTKCFSLCYCIFGGETNRPY